MLGQHRVRDTSSAAVEIEVTGYSVIPARSSRHEKSKGPNFWLRRVVVASALGATTLLAAAGWVYYGNHEEQLGKASQQPKIDQLENDNLKLTNDLNRAKQSADYYADRQRADAARASTLNHLMAKQGLPWLKGRVDVFFNDTQVDSIGDPIVLDPSFGAYGVDPNATGWQAVVSQSRNYGRGVEAYTRDAHNTTFKFYDERGEQLTYEDLWNSPYVRLSNISIEETLDGWSQLTTQSGQLIGSTDYSG